MVKQEYGRVVVLGLLAGLVGGLLGGRVLHTDSVIAQEGAPRSQIVTVRQLIVTDKDGNPRVQLAVSDAGEPRLDFLNKDGRSIASFGLTQEGTPDLRLNAKDGAPRIRLALLTKGDPRLDFTMDQEGKPVASFGVSPDGWPNLRLGGKEGNAGTTLTFLGGNPRILLEDTKGEVNTVLAAAPDKAALVLYKDGKARTSLALDGLGLVSAEGKPRARLELMEGGEPRLTLKDKEGRRMFGLSVEPLPKKEEPLLAMYDTKDVLRVGLSLDDVGRPNLIMRDGPLLSLIDKTGEDGIFMSVEEGNRPSVFLSSKMGKHSAFLGLRDNQEMALDLLDEKLKHRASFSLTPDGTPSLMLRDKEEKAVWTAMPPPK